MRKLAGFQFLILAWLLALSPSAFCDSVTLIDGWVKLGNAWDYTVHKTLDENTTTDTWVSRTGKFTTKSSKDYQGYSYLVYSTFAPGVATSSTDDWLSLSSSYLRNIYMWNPSYTRVVKAASSTSSANPPEMLPVTVSTTAKNKSLGTGAMTCTDGTNLWTENSQSWVTYVGKETISIPIGDFDCIVVYVEQEWTRSAPSAVTYWYGINGTTYWIHPQYGIMKKKFLESWMNGDTGLTYVNDETSTLTRMNLIPDLIPNTPTGWPAPLIVSNSTGTRTQDTLKVGKTAYIDMSFANDSSFTIPTTIPVKCTVYDGDTSIAQKQTNGFSLGTKIYWNDVPCTFQTPGTRELRMVVDPLNGVAESNEANNVYSLSVNVADLPDLTVESITTTPAKPKDNEEIFVGFKVRNWGLVQSAECTYTVSVDGAAQYSAFMPILASRGGVYPVTGISIGYLPIGSHEIEVSVDTAGVVDETNELNNGTQKTFQVTHSKAASKRWELYR